MMSTTLWVLLYVLVSFIYYKPASCVALSNLNHIINPWECDHWFYNKYSLDPLQNIHEAIVISNGSIQLQFEINIINNCNDNAYCNLLSIIDTQNGFEIISVSINGIEDKLKVTSTNNYQLTDVYYVSNINQLLSVNKDEYIPIYITFTERGNQWLEINHIKYYSAIVPVTDDSNYNQLILSSNSASLYSLFIGTNSSNSSNSLSGYIQHICTVSDNALSPISNISVAPSNEVNAFCNEDGDEFEFAFFDSELNASIYFSWSTDLFLKPLIQNNTYYYVISYHLNTNTTNNPQLIDAYCDVTKFGDLIQCIGKWYIYNITSNEWFNNPYILHLYPCTLCMTTDSSKRGALAYHGGKWSYSGFNEQLLGPEYLFQRWPEVMFPVINGNEYSFYISTVQDRNHIYWKCHIGTNLGADYIFNFQDIKECVLQNKTFANHNEDFIAEFKVSANLYICDELAPTLGCYETETVLPFTSDADLVVYWNNTRYVLHVEGHGEAIDNTLLWRSNDMEWQNNVNYTRLQNVTVDLRHNSQQWARIQNKLYVIPFVAVSIIEIDLLTAQHRVLTDISYHDIDNYFYMGALLAMCGNSTHLFVLSKDYGINIYEIETNIWSETAVTQLYDVSCCVLVRDTELYILGGMWWNGTILDYVYEEVRYSDEIYVYDLNSEQLTELNVTLNARLTNIRATLVNSHYIYIYFGYTKSENETFYFQILDTRDNQIHYTFDYTLDYWHTFINPTGYFDTEMNQLVVYAGRSVYFQQTDHIIANLHDTQVIAGESFDVLSLIELNGCDIEVMNAFAATFLFSSMELSVNHKVEIKNGICSVICSGDEFAVCSPCNIGIIPKIPYDFIDSSTISVTLTSDTVIEAFDDEFIVNMDGCRRGEGISSSSNILDCAVCDENEFKLKTGNTECFRCNSNIDDGFQCNGGYDITISYNVWIDGVDTSNKKEFIPLFLIDTDDEIFSTQCPPKYCCVEPNGCDFTRDILLNSSDSKLYQYDSESGVLCAKYRDLNAPLCGKCIADKYEMLGSSSCGDCNYYHNLWLLGLIFVGAVLFDLYLLRDVSPRKQEEHTAKELDYKKLIRNDEMRCLTVMVTKITVYYYQSLSQILSSKGVTNSLLPLLTIFNFSFDQNFGSSGFCLIPFIDNGLDEILLSSIFIIFAVSNFIWIYLLKLIQQKPTRRVWMAIFKLFTISVGTLLNTGFKLLSCIIFPNGRFLHFYNSSRKCVDGYWFLGLFICCSSIFIFIVIYSKIYKQSTEERQSPHNVFRKIILVYHPSSWWFEFFLFSRRLIIAFFTSSTFLWQQKYSEANALLLVILVIYLFVHSRVNPFKYWRLNVLETFCLIALVAVLNLLQQTQTESNNRIEIYIALIIIMPLLFMLYTVFRILITIYMTTTNKTLFSSRQLQKIQSLTSRTDITINTNIHHEIDEKKGNDNDDNIERQIKTENHVKKEGNPQTELTKIQLSDINNDNKIENEMKTENIVQSNNDEIVIEDMINIDIPTKDHQKLTDGTEHEMESVSSTVISAENESSVEI